MDIVDKKYIGVMVEECENTYSLGVTIMLNEHAYRIDGKKIWHIDIIIDFFKWFIGIRIGKDESR